jgi:pimeloyl-ACP methyl ester carboxylesterase
VKQNLVLIPGVGGDSVLWQFQMRHLADLARMTVPDLSSCSSRKEMADKVLSSVSGPFAMAGISMGGWVGFEVAAREPDRITKFAPIATWARPNPMAESFQKEALRKMKEGFFKEFLSTLDAFPVSPAKLSDSHFFEFLKSHMRNVQENVYLRQFEAYLNDYDSRRLLTRIICPTLVIAGRDDPMFTVDEHVFIADHIKSAKFAIIEDCGHYVTIEQPQALSALLRYWLMYF